MRRLIAATLLLVALPGRSSPGEDPPSEVPFEKDPSRDEFMEASRLAEQGRTDGYRRLIKLNQTGQSAEWAEAANEEVSRLLFKDTTKWLRAVAPLDGPALRGHLEGSGGSWGLLEVLPEEHGGIPTFRLTVLPRLRTAKGTPGEQALARFMVEVLTGGEVAPSILGIRPGESSFRDVMGLLGEAQVIREGGESPLSRLCYRSRESNETTALFFESSALGSNGERVSQYRIEDRSPGSMPRECARSRLVTRSLTLLSGIGPGMSCEEALRLLGPSKSSFQGGAEIKRSSKREMTLTEVAGLMEALGGNRPRSTLLHVREGTRVRCLKEHVSEVEVYRFEEW